MLTSANFRTKVFTWTTNINLTIPKTLLVDYPDIIKSSSSSTAIIGQPLSAIYVYHFLGVDPATGVYQFADKNGKPTLTPNSITDKNVIVDLAPKFYGGFQNTFSYKGIQLDVLFSFVKQIAQNSSYGFGYPGYFYSGNQLASLLSDRWQKPGDIKSIQRFTYGTDLADALGNIYQSDASWKDASYIRLKNVSLSWTLPADWTTKLHLNNLNVFILGQNLWTLTNYKGLDPETKSSSSLPPLRVITMGLKVGL